VVDEQEYRQRRAGMAYKLPILSARFECRNKYPVVSGAVTMAMMETA
jgi:hypothetical protein